MSKLILMFVREINTDVDIEIYLLKKNIIPIYVFDGKAPDLKSKVIQERKEIKKKAWEKLESITNEKEKIKYFKRTVSISWKQLEECKELLQLMGIPYVEAPEEADSQCAWLVKNGFASGVLTEDEVWVIVKRTINGATKRFVECFSDFDFDETSATSFKFLDSHLSYSGSATTTLSGLSHLEGQTVSILGDGATHANKVVNGSGQITLDRSVTSACVGLAYDSILQTMRIEGGAAEGTSQGKTKRISKVVLRLFETVGVKVGPSLTNLETIPFRTTSSLLSNPVDTLLSGDKEIEFNDDYNSDGFIFIKQDQPLPCSILSIYPTLVKSDG